MTASWKRLTNVIIINQRVLSFLRFIPLPVIKKSPATLQYSLDVLTVEMRQEAVVAGKAGEGRWWKGVIRNQKP